MPHAPVAFWMVGLTALLSASASLANPPQARPASPQPRPGNTQAVAVDEVDVFGVKMLYPTRAGGETWFLSDNPTNDPRFLPQDTIVQNADGSWKVTDSQVRMLVLTSTGYDPARIATYDRDVLASQGYMLAPNDWRNVEITGFVRVNRTSELVEDFSWTARGGRHTDQRSCEGSAYHGRLQYDGRAKWSKESWHVHYISNALQTATPSSLVGRWIGLKAVMRNVTVDGKQAVKLELYLNDNADRLTWTLAREEQDSGSWGGDSLTCDGSEAAMPMTWGGPIVIFRWDRAEDVDFKWLSVREVETGSSNSDTTPPTITIDSPESGATVSDVVSISATATDDTGVSQVRFFVDGVLIGTDAAVPYSTTWDACRSGAGLHRITASALDASGNVGSASPVSVSVPDSVSIQKAEYVVSKQVLQVEATTASTDATVTVYKTDTMELLGTLRANGPGRHRGSLSWPTNPGNITVRSSLGCSATKDVTAK